MFSRPARKLRMDSGFSSESSFQGACAGDQAIADAAVTPAVLKTDAEDSGCCRGTDDDSQSDLEGETAASAAGGKLGKKVEGEFEYEDEDDYSDGYEDCSDSDDAEFDWCDNEDPDDEMDSAEDDEEKCESDTEQGLVSFKASLQDCETESDSSDDSENDASDEDEDDEEESEDEDEDDWDCVDGQVCHDEEALAEFQLPSFPCPSFQKPPFRRSASTSAVLDCTPVKTSAEATASVCTTAERDAKPNSDFVPELPSGRFSHLQCRRSNSVPCDVPVSDIAKAGGSSASLCGGERPHIRERLEALKQRLEEKRASGFTLESSRHSNCCTPFGDESSESSPLHADGKKRVRFASGPSFITVHRIVAWDFAYRAARVADWSRCRMDERRFRKRIESLEPIISPVLADSHRARRLSSMDQYRISADEGKC